MWGNANVSRFPVPSSGPQNVKKLILSNIIFGTHDASGWIPETHECRSDTGTFSPMTLAKAIRMCVLWDQSLCGAEWYRTNVFFHTGWAWVLVNQARHEYCFLRIRRLAPVYSIYTVGDCKQFRAMWIFDHGARFFSPMPESGVTFVVNGLYCFRRVHVMSTAWWLFCTSIIGRAILRQCGFECTSSGEIKCFKTDSHSQFYFV
jgi:hypothetical protein